jgi:cellulase
MWATDKMIQGKYTGKKGQHKFTLPKVAPGEYVIRPELIGLHEGDRVGGAQFYQECIHVKVGGSGNIALPAGVAIPGHLKAQDAGVLFNIYGGFTSYPIPGPKLWNGAGAAAPAAPPAATTTKAATPAATTTKAVVAAPTTTKAAAVPTKAATTLATVAKPAPTAVAGGATAQKYAQCGGQGFTGATACAAGSKCTVQNQWYAQCL